MNVQLDTAYWIGLLISVALPVLVGLVTTRVTHAGAKAVLLLALSGVNGLLVEVANPGPGFDLGTAAVLALVAFATGVLAHFGLWKPVGVADKAQASLITERPQPRGI
ncbi:hypothetical protein [Streptomyces sp. DH12]|uniref:hypothetical protein n=1 Tax=Streptomyces sp. DH12 TaxID=2857010 RepID=UPI001E32DE5C|nr:hypothetical protein [Streptomyces sp. DH12]